MVTVNILRVTEIELTCQFALLGAFLVFLPRAEGDSH